MSLDLKRVQFKAAPAAAAEVEVAVGVGMVVEGVITVAMEGVITVAVMVEGVSVVVVTRR